MLFPAPPHSPCPCKFVGKHLSSRLNPTYILLTRGGEYKVKNQTKLFR